MAAHFRGNLGIARIDRRTRLRSAPDENRLEDMREDADSDAERTAGCPDDEVVWLTGGIEDPVLPAECGEEVVLVMRVLLLYNGPPERLLPDLLPLSYDRILSVLLRAINGPELEKASADGSFISIERAVEEGRTIYDGSGRLGA